MLRHLRPNCSVLAGVQTHGCDLPAHAQSRLPEGGALPQPVPEAGESPAAQVRLVLISLMLTFINWSARGYTHNQGCSLRLTFPTDNNVREGRSFETMLCVKKTSQQNIFCVIHWRKSHRFGATRGRVNDHIYSLVFKRLLLFIQVKLNQSTCVSVALYTNSNNNIYF